MRARLISLSSLVFSFSRSLVLALSLVRARVYSVFSLFLSLPGLLSACLALSVTLFLSLSHTFHWVEYRCHSRCHLIAPASIRLPLSLSVSLSLSFLIPFSVSALFPVAGVLALDFFLSLFSLLRDLLFSLSVFPVPFISFSFFPTLSLSFSHYFLFLSLSVVPLIFLLLAFLPCL